VIRSRGTAMKMRNAAILFFSLVATAHSYAADCEKAKLEEGERLSAYLHDYSQECIDRKVESQLEVWKIAPSTTGTERDEANVSRMVAAWKDISTAFGKLAEETPDNVAMKNTYRQLALRADIARSALALALQQQASPDIAAFKRDAWQISPQMTLLEYTRPAEPHLPLIDVRTALNQDCKVPTSSLCASTLKQGRELMLQWRLADRISGIASSTSIRAIAQQINAKDKLWNTYLYDSKPMLPPDFFLTDLMERGWKKSDQYPEGFRAPPKTQWFLLHPSFGVEYATAAVDGEQMKPVVYVEIFGANRWSEDSRWIDVWGLRTFSGFSLIYSYADRAGVKDTGFGGLFTFNNVYSIGVTRYGHDTGVLLSLDLANLYRDRLKPQYEALRINLNNQLKVP
jgi:hypothetical protein